MTVLQLHVYNANVQFRWGQEGTDEWTILHRIQENRFETNWDSLKRGIAVFKQSKKSLICISFYITLMISLTFRFLLGLYL